MTFQDLNLSKSLLNALDDLGLTTPTSIQQKAFSPIMGGKNIVGIAQTGTGKTFAYLLPLLRLWKYTNSPHPQILIMVPTRELVVQLVQEIEKLTTYISISTVGVYGGTNIRTHVQQVQTGAHIIVGTPGRLLDLILKGALKTKNIKKLVIDEVDEMLNLGFRTQLNSIVEYLPQKRQNLMFSATLPVEVEQIIDMYTQHFDKIEAAPSGTPLENIDQSAYAVQNFNTKVNLLSLLCSVDTSFSKVLVFVSTKKMADILYERMEEKFGEHVGIIHSSKSQNHRLNTVNSFQKGDLKYIIATDIIARGLDVSMVSHVINFDLPEKVENYIHRIGRTGRADKQGIAITFFTKQEKEVKSQIESFMNMSIPIKSIPDELEISEELIDLEKPSEYVPYNPHKMKQHKPSGDAFHEKSAKNSKINSKRNYEDLLKKKYKKQYRKKDRR